MNRLVAGLVPLSLAVALFAASKASADPPASHFKTNFKFEARFADGTQTFNENLGFVVNIPINPLFGWACSRLSPAVVDGRMRGSFSCSNDGFRTNVLTLVGCKTGTEDALHTSGMRIFAARPDGKPQGSPVDAGAHDGGFSPTLGAYIDLAVSCETVKVP